MAFRTHIFALLCCMAVFTASTASAITLGGGASTGQQLRTFNSYAVSNQHPLPPGQDTEFLYIDNLDTFNRIFVLTTTMGPRPDVVTEEFFRDNAILAVIKNGLWNMEPQGVGAERQFAALAYTAEKVPASFEAVTPLIVAIPLGLSDTYRFIENGGAVGVVTSKDDIGSLREQNPDAHVSGGWSGYREVDHDALIYFEQALRGLVGASYEPIMYSAQLVNGVNYRFVCKQTLSTNPPVLGIAIVSFHVDFNDRVSSPDIQTIVK